MWNFSGQLQADFDRMPALRLRFFKRMPTLALAACEKILSEIP